MKHCKPPLEHFVEDQDYTPSFIPMKRRIGFDVPPATNRRKTAKRYKSRRLAIKRGGYSYRSRFGMMGDSTWSY